MVLVYTVFVLIGIVYVVADHNEKEGTVDSEIFARILFSRIALKLKDIFATKKSATRA